MILALLVLARFLGSGQVPFAEDSACLRAGLRLEPRPLGSGVFGIRVKGPA
jgi:hypothetical protein